MSEEKDINLGEIRKRYQPLRERTDRILRDSGISEGPEFRKARKKFTKEAYLAGIDEVTLLPIRSLFETRLQEELDRSERNGEPLTMGLIDLNLLRKINKKGLPEGDKALRAVAEKILASIRRTDYAARYGGDEFVIVLPHTPAAPATQIAERIRRAVEKNVFLEKDGYTLRITASFGVASYPGTAGSKEDLLRLADQAMYKVKYHTKNGVYSII